MDWEGSEFAFNLDRNNIGPEVSDQIGTFGGANVEFTATDPESGESTAFTVWIGGDDFDDWLNNYYEIAREIISDVLADEQGGSFDGILAVTGISL